MIDPASHQVTHVLLGEGHVFGRKEVAIPSGAVTGVGADGIRLNITKQQVQDLPPADIDHPGGNGAPAVRVIDPDDLRDDPYARSVLPQAEEFRRRLPGP